MSIAILILTLAVEVLILIVAPIFEPLPEIEDTVTYEETKRLMLMDLKL